MLRWYSSSVVSCSLDATCRTTTAKEGGWLQAGAPLLVWLTWGARKTPEELEARESRETKFKFGTYENSIVEMISSALHADWFQPQVQAYLDMLPNLKAGVIVGVFKKRGYALGCSASWKAASLNVFAACAAHGGMVYYCPWVACCMAWSLHDRVWQYEESDRSSFITFMVISWRNSI